MGEPGWLGRPGDQGPEGVPGRYEPNLDLIIEGPEGSQGLVGEWCLKNLQF